MTDVAARLASYRDRLDAAGLGRYADQLSEVAAPSVRLLADSQIEAAAVGASRLGGVPDLAADQPWPVNDDGTPLSFIAQLDLKEMATYEVEGILPTSGLLSFFYAAATQNAWGFDPADHGAWAVIHTGADSTVEPRDAPEGSRRGGGFLLLGSGRISS